MYYRYKSRKKNGKIKYFFFLFVLVVFFVVLVFSFRETFFFWEYSSNSLEKEFNQISKLKTKSEKKRSLLNLIKKINDFKHDNMLSPDLFLVSAKIHFLLGELIWDNNITSLLVNEDLSLLSKIRKKQFYHAIRDLKKGIVLQEDSDIDSEYLLILAKSLFYTEYSDVDTIFALIYNLFEHGSLLNENDVRFYSVIAILAGEQKKGLEFLMNYGGIHKDIKGELFYASSEKLAGNNTNAIIAYKKILSQKISENIKKEVSYKLAVLYYKQGLYNSSLSMLNKYSEDLNCSILIGKNYFSMGYKKQAKKKWNKLLKLNSNNLELKKLLKIR